MKKLSFWAHNHKIAARLSIVSFYILLNIAGLFTGDILYSLHIALPFSFYLLCIFFTLFGVTIYPSKGKKTAYRNFYAKQKFADCILILTTFFFTVYAGNSINDRQFNPVYGNSFIVKKSNVMPVSQKKETRRNFKKLIKEFRKKYKEATKTQKTIGIILAILFACALTVVLGGLACSISCSGSEALALIVLFAGIGGIVFGLIKLIQAIKRGPRKKQISSKE